MKKNKVDIIITVRGAGKTYQTKKDILKHMYLKNGMSYDMLEEAYNQACKKIYQLKNDNIEYQNRLYNTIKYIENNMCINKVKLRHILNGEDE